MPALKLTRVFDEYALSPREELGKVLLRLLNRPFSFVGHGPDGKALALLKRGADPNYEEGRAPPLHVAMQLRKDALACAFIHAGADIWRKNRIFALTWDALMEAATGGLEETAALLLEKGLQPDARDSHGRTALFHAVNHGKSVRMVHMLLDAGADVNARDNAGVTPLLHAAKRCVTMHRGDAPAITPAVVEALVAAGGDTRARDGAGRSAMDILGTHISGIAPEARQIIGAAAQRQRDAALQKSIAAIAQGASRPLRNPGPLKLRKQAQRPGSSAFPAHSGLNKS